MLSSSKPKLVRHYVITRNAKGVTNLIDGRHARNCAIAPARNRGRSNASNTSKRFLRYIKLN